MEAFSFDWILAGCSTGFYFCAKLFDFNRRAYENTCNILFFVAFNAHNYAAKQGRSFVGYLQSEPCYLIKVFVL